MKQKLLFIYNPRAGKERIKSHLFGIIDVFSKAGYVVTTWPTMAQGDAEVIAEENAAGYDLIVCSGGDGTLDEVVTGMLRGGVKKSLGYIPAGSTNDFGASLMLPRRMRHAAEVAVSGRDFLCDIGKFNLAHFVYVAAFGLFTDVTYETDQQLKNVLGHAAYILEGMKRVADVKTYHMTVSYDGETITGDFIVGMITNSESVGGIKGITGSHVALDDGLLEVVLVRKPPIGEINRTVAALFDRNISSEYVVSFETDHVTITSDIKTAWTLDGEYGGEVTVADISCVPGAVSIRIPK